MKTSFVSLSLRDELKGKNSCLQIFLITNRETNSPLKFSAQTDITYSNSKIGNERLSKYIVRRIRDTKDSTVCIK